jgi:hypothetical protein
MAAHDDVLRPCFRHAAVAVGNQYMYVFGGQSALDVIPDMDNIAMDSISILDVNSGQWTIQATKGASSS